MGMPVLEKTKEFMFNPTHAFRGVKEEPAADTFRYLVILVFFYAGMATVMTILQVFPHPFSSEFSSPGIPVLDPVRIIIDIFSIVVSTILTLVIYGVWLHLWVFLLGGRKGIWQTFKSVFYSATPSLILAWIPVIGTLVGIVWTVIINVIGIKELHGLDTTKSALAVVLAIVFFVVIVVIALGALLVAVLSSLPMTE